MNTFNRLWKKLAGSKEYREEFVGEQVKRGIPFQIRSLLKQYGWKQEELATRSNLTQGAISRAQSPNYGNLSLNTLIRIAAGFDVALIVKFVPFTELGRWFIELSEESVKVQNFDADKARFSMKVVRVDPSPMNAKVKCHQLECGHDVFLPCKSKKKYLFCEKCAD